MDSGGGLKIKKHARKGKILDWDFFVFSAPFTMAPCLFSSVLAVIQP